MREALRNAITMEESHRGKHKIVINCASAKDMRKIADCLADMKFNPSTDFDSDRKRIYLAGPMTGIADLNFPAFHEATARMRDEGHHVINPAEINSDPSAQWVDCMRADIRELVTCNTIALLPGWEKSRGAQLEHHLAVALGFSVEYLGEHEELRASEAMGAI